MYMNNPHSAMFGRIFSVIALVGSLTLCLSSCSSKYEEKPMGQYNLVIQKGGATLGYSPQSGVQLLEQN